MGRAKNGMFIAVPEELKCCVNDVSPAFWRLQAITIKSETSTLLLINSYFPNDPRTANFADEALIETFTHIKRVIDNNDFDLLCICGDINADFSRKTGFVNFVQQQVADLNLTTAWHRHEVDFTFIYNDADDTSHVAVLDHFLLNNLAETAVIAAGVLHIPENLSDHCPIYCNVDLGLITVDKTFKHKENIMEKPSWKKATEAEKLEYTELLEEQLSLIRIPDSLHCTEVQCKDVNHCNEADDFITKVLETVEQVSVSTLPSSSPPRHPSKAPVPGWKNLVEPFRDKAYFWHQIWISAGRPLNTELHKIMKRSRNIYHYNYRKCRKSELIISKNKLLDACLNGKGDVFKEIRKLRANKPIVATSMDGIKSNIADHFKGIYSTLYNSTNDANEVVEIAAEIESKINILSLLDVEKVTPEVVKKAAANLCDSKSDPVFTFNSDCVKHGTSQLFHKLAIAFKSFLIHGHISYFLMLATLLPIIKDKLGSVNSSSNYRSIAISSLILKLLDWIILIIYGDVLGVDELQFAYQPGCSTTMCTWTVIETVDYFLRHGGEVFGCMMDMSKAFDLVKHSLLFRKLLDAGLPVIFIRLLIFIYVNQFANVYWDGCFSTIFSLTNGVRQGAILSAILYCFYVNNLYKILRRNGSGCWINSQYFGILGYSDDSFLLAPSLDSLQEMLTICEEYAEIHNLKFSTDANPLKCKTKCIAFLGRDRPLKQVVLCGNHLPWVNNGKHLGNTIENNINGMKMDIKQKRAKFIAKNNELNQEFHFAHPKTKIELNRIYNGHFTGSPLWDLFSRETEMLCNSWNKSVRLMLGVPLNTHRYFLEPLSGLKHLKFPLTTRFLNFLSQIKKSPQILPSIL